MTEMAALPQVAWPEITGKGLECLVSLIKSLEMTQHLSALELERCQRIQLEVLAGYAARHSPFFAGRLKRARLKPADFREPGALQRLDMLHRRDIQQAGNAMTCAEVPPRHLPLQQGRDVGFDRRTGGGHAHRPQPLVLDGHDHARASLERP